NYVPGTPCQRHPPSTRSTAPVEYDDAELLKNSTAPTTSAGSAHRPRATTASSSLRAPSAQFSEMSVRNGPGWTVLTRTVGASSLANPWVRPCSRDLAAAYGRAFPDRRMPPTEPMLTIDPPPDSTILRPTSAASLKGPRRLPAIVLSNRASLTP